jgi:hypothetical protein
VNFSRSSRYVVAAVLVSGQLCAQTAPATDEAAQAEVAPVEAATAKVATEAEPPRERPPWADETTLETSDEAPPSSARTNLFITGGAVTLGFYGLGFGTSYLWPNSPVAEELRIPVVGAYAAVFGAGCGDSERGCGTFETVLRTGLATLSALGQTGGVLLLGEAIFMDTAPSGDAALQSPSPNAASAKAAPPALYYAPVVDEHSFGVWVGGSF